MLLRRTGRHDEQFVTTGPVARKSLGFFRNFGWALALARACHIVRRGFCPLPASLPITAALRLPTLFPLRARPIPLGRSPASPATGRLLTGRTAISRLGMRRLKPAFASLEQATPGSRRPAARDVAALTCRFVPPRVQRVHGSLLLPTDQVSGRSCCFFSRRFYPSMQLRRNDAAAALQGLHQLTPVCVAT